MNNTNIQDINQAIKLPDSNSGSDSGTPIQSTIDPVKTLMIEVAKTGSILPIQSTTDPVGTNQDTTNQAVATNQGGTSTTETSSTVTDPAVVTCNAGSVSFHTTR